MEEKLRIFKGKLYKGAVRVPLECDNNEQIEFISRLKKVKDEYMNDSMQVINTTTEPCIMQSKLLCICGNLITFESRGYSEEEAHEEMAFVERKCNSCSEEYVIKEDPNDYGEFLVYSKTKRNREEAHKNATLKMKF